MDDGGPKPNIKPLLCYTCTFIGVIQLRTLDTYTTAAEVQWPPFDLIYTAMDN